MMMLLSGADCTRRNSYRNAIHWAMKVDTVNKIVDLGGLETIDAVDEEADPSSLGGKAWAYGKGKEASQTRCISAAEGRRKAHALKRLRSTIIVKLPRFSVGRGGKIME